mmetsp:Transcript_5936/g.26268  ORF Transcript_5936/g.26268 Transcript_5936/m.26268 type:complete len:219 (-) Transcript_5936:38-694(-)
MSAVTERSPSSPRVRLAVPFDPSFAPAGGLDSAVAAAAARGWREPTALASCSVASASIASSLRGSSSRSATSASASRADASWRRMFAAAASAAAPGLAHPNIGLTLCSTSSMTPRTKPEGRMSSASRSSLGIPRPMASLSRASWIRTAERSASIASLRLPNASSDRARCSCAAATAALRCDIAKSLTNPRLPGSWSPCALLRRSLASSTLARRRSATT